MISSQSQEAQGLRLLQTWKAKGLAIEMSFTDCEGAFGFKFVGCLQEHSTDERLNFSGVGCEVFLDIRHASLENVVSKEGLKQNALPTSVFGESVTVHFAGLGRCKLVTRSRPDEEEELN